MTESDHWARRAEEIMAASTPACSECGESLEAETELCAACQDRVDASLWRDLLAAAKAGHVLVFERGGLTVNGDRAFALDAAAVALARLK